jgi:hypothetical protein
VYRLYPSPSSWRPHAPAARRQLQAGPAVESGDRQIEIDAPTLIAGSTVAWAAADVLHELVGHGGAAALIGVPVRAVSTTTVYLAWDDQINTAADSVTINAAGTVVNLATGGLALLARARGG